MFYAFNKGLFDKRDFRFGDLFFYLK